MFSRTERFVYFSDDSAGTYKLFQYYFFQLVLIIFILLLKDIFKYCEYEFWEWKWCNKIAVLAI